jgi:hypothetical protein
MGVHDGRFTIRTSKAVVQHMHPLLRLLIGGDRRSIGASNRVATMATGRPELIGILVAGIESADAVLRMRCADALEKATARAPELLSPYKAKILRDLSKIDQKEVRWHVIPMLTRLSLSKSETAAVMDMLLHYTNDPSSIVKTMAMQALVDLALRNPHLLADVKRHIEELSIIGTPAMKARGKKLLPSLANISN